MKIIKTLFDRCYVLEPSSREDSRGFIEVFFSARELSTIGADFAVAEQRIYTMPKKHTFFGIHYQSRDCPQRKLIGVVQGRGLDYIVDLRKDSPTYRHYETVELNADDPRLVYIPEGFGHAFLSLEDNTMQLFAVDCYFHNEHTGVISYKDPGIALELPTDEIILSDYDRDAPSII